VRTSGVTVARQRLYETAAALDYDVGDHVRLHVEPWAHHERYHPCVGLPQVGKVRGAECPGGFLRDVRHRRIGRHEMKAKWHGFDFGQDLQVRFVLD
jgi:hypothetical protein